MPQASRSVVVNVKPEQLMSVIGDYEKYPEFLPEVKKIAVKKISDTVTEVTYEIDVIKRLTYTLRLEQKSPLLVSWSFVKGDFFKKNEGSWVLKPEGEGKTQATYNLEVGFGGLIPVPAAITDRLTAQSLPGLLDNFKKRAEKLFPPAA